MRYFSLFASISGITSATSDNVLVIVESSIFESAKDFTPSVTVTFQFSEVGVVWNFRMSE